MYFLAAIVLILSLARSDPPVELFMEAASRDARRAQTALNQIAAAWKDSYTPMFIDLARLFRPAPRSVDLSLPSAPAATPDAQVRQRLIRFLEKQTGQKFGDDLDKWRRWMWKLDYSPHPDYTTFKSIVYGLIDPRMSNFFPPHARSVIRLDEIDWGGVGVNGIPPLDHPKVVNAEEATYLKDSNVVFGIVVNGEARAYPKRILAWHEMARDRIGGVELTIIYCTLCGTVLPYESHVGGRLFTFGTSGLLYRSNKLFFDEETQSLWSTLEGKPVVGELAGSGLELTLKSSVTTTWGEWRGLHPAATVLSLDTGYERDYSEGAAYRDYFSTDRLMFQVSQTDTRLKNKAEVLVMRLPSGNGTDRMPVAIDIEFLKKNPVYHGQAGGVSFVVTTSSAGANRVYEAPSVRLVRRRKDDSIEDQNGRLWRPNEDALVAVDDASMRFKRITSNRAFWFGWYAQFPNTELIK